MTHIRFVVLLCLLGVINAQSSCNETNIYQTYDDLVSCLQSVPFSESIKNGTLATLRSIIPSYVFVDSVQNSADPGGKLGPRDGEPKPDLRNLNIFWQYCEEGDYIIVVTDGVYDNFDLRHQGYIPSDVGLEGSDWFTCAKDAAEVLNRRHVEEQITKILSNIENKDLNADSICIALTQYCYNLTENTRQFMMENPTLRLPKDYSKYPGKVDHCTVVCYQVGNGGVSIDQWFGK